MPEENLNQDTPITGNVSKATVQGERSTTDSPLKDHLEGQQKDSPRIERNDTVDEGVKGGNDTVIEHGPAIKDQVLGEENQHQPQDQKPKNNEEPSNKKFPSSDDEDMGHYFESSNEEDISAQPGVQALILNLLHQRYQLQ
jgi:hypothetical protein